MPSEIKIFPQLMWITLRGDITAADVFHHAGDVARVELASSVSPDRFTDLSETTSHPDFDGLANFAAVRSEAKLRNNVKSAVYAPTDLQYAIARTFQRLNVNPLIELRVFRDRTEALQWVGWSSA